MARTPTQTTAPAELMPADQQAEQQLVTLQDNAIVQHEAELNQLAHSLGYQGSLTVAGHFLGNIMPAAQIDALTVAGGIILILIGLKILLEHIIIFLEIQNINFGFLQFYLK